MKETFRGLQASKYGQRNVDIKSYGGGEAGFPENLFPFQKSTPIYRILHHTLIKYREMMISIS
jgi:hypothetical protein